MFGKLFKHGVELGVNKLMGKKLTKSAALAGSGGVVVILLGRMGWLDLTAFSQEELVGMACFATVAVNFVRQFVARQVSE